MNRIFDITAFGANPDGITDSSDAIEAAILAAVGCSGAVFVPPGTFLATRQMGFPTTATRITIFGVGSNVSVLLFKECNGIDMEFAQDVNGKQPYGLVLRNVGLKPLGKSGVALRVSYGEPTITSDHAHESSAFENVQIISDTEGAWDGGIILESGWNLTLNNVWCSGDDCGGDWSKLHGFGLSLLGMTVNCHVQNCRFNFWDTGVAQFSTNERNSEGLFCSNNSMVAVKCGYDIRGIAEGAGRISTFTLVGGLVEVRDVPLLAQQQAIRLERVWTALITGAQFLSNAVSDNTAHITYGILAVNSAGVVVSACDINAFNYGFHSAAECRALAVTGCTFTNTAKQIIFPDGTSGSRSFGHVRFNDAQFEWTANPALNKIGFVN